MAGKNKDDEARKTAELMERVSDLEKPEIWDVDTDRYIQRWLIARNWNVDKAEAMLRKSMEFRQKNNCAEILQTYEAPEVLEKYFVGGVCGFDREGCPIWLDPFTLLDSRGMLHSVTKDQVLRYKNHSCEKLLALLQSQTIKLGKPVDQIIIIYDVAGLSWRHLYPPGIESFRNIVSMFEDNYPELMRKTYIVNAPRLFILAYNMIKSVISPRTRDKVHMLGARWKEALLKDIDADQLPVNYGGTQVDENGDPRCSSKVKYGGEVPNSYYFTDEDISTEMQSIHVPRSANKHVEFEITVDRCQLRYTIKTEKRDVGVGFLYKPLHSKKTKEKDMEVIEEVKRVNAHMAPQSGVVECHKTGTYILVLDNTFSWAKGKNVKYSVEIVPIEGDDDSFSSALDFDANDETIEELVVGNGC